MILPPQCIGAVIVTSFPLLTFAEYFTNPPSFVNSVDGTQIKTEDLSTMFTFGQKVQITWFVPSLPNISLSVARWGDPNDTVITSFLTNKQNLGYYTWTIGVDDGVDLKMISASPKFGFRLEDPTGKLTSTGHPPGFIDSTLRSRSFVIQPNVTTSSSSSTLGPTPSTLSPSVNSLSTTTSSASTALASTTTAASAGTTTTTASASATPLLHSGLSRSAVVGLAIGLCVASMLALIAVLLLYLQRRPAKNVQAENANLVVRTEESTGVNSMRPGLQAGLNADPSAAELSGFPSFRPFRSGLGNSRLSDLGNLTLSRQELSVERFSNQELGNSTLSRQELSVERFSNQELGNSTFSRQELSAER